MRIFAIGNQASFAYEDLKVNTQDDEGNDNNSNINKNGNIIFSNNDRKLNDFSFFTISSST